MRYFPLVDVLLTFQEECASPWVFLALAESLGRSFIRFSVEFPVEYGDVAFQGPLFIKVCHDPVDIVDFPDVSVDESPEVLMRSFWWFVVEEFLDRAMNVSAVREYLQFAGNVRDRICDGRNLASLGCLVRAWYWSGGGVSLWGSPSPGGSGPYWGFAASSVCGHQCDVITVWGSFPDGHVVHLHAVWWPSKGFGDAPRVA